MRILVASALLAFSSLPMMTFVHADNCFALSGTNKSDISANDKPTTLKIRIADCAEGAILEVKGRYELFDPISHLILDSGFFGKRAAIIADGSGICWGDRLPSIHQIRIVPVNNETTTLVNGIEYRGCLDVYNLNGQIAIINEIDIESYLKSTLSSQVPLQSEERLLEAIAVIARTNAYYLAQRNPQAHWHVTAEEAKYFGHGMALQNIAIDRAIENTRHIVMTYRSHPFASTWTEDSAGRTANYSHIFRKQVLTPSGVSAPLAARERPKHTWTTSIAGNELAKAFGFNKLTAIHPYLDQESEKVYAVQLTDGIISKNVDFFALQQFLGAEKLRSNDFAVSIKDDKVIFKGWGKGHGVGLCLYSAHIMAEKGTSVGKILSHFYPQVEMKKIRSLSQNE